MKNKLLLSLLLPFFIFISFIILYTKAVDKTQSEYLARYTQAKSKQYEIIYNSFRKLAINSYYGILNKPSILEIIKKTQDGDSDRNLIRKELYKKVKPDYRKFHMLGINYVTFSLPDSTMFLSMYNKNAYKEKLSRDSILYVNKNQMPFEGLEEGSNPAFRFVYPSYDIQGNYLAAIEASFDVKELMNELEKSFDTKSRMIYKKSVLEKSTFTDIDTCYDTSIESPHYLTRKDTSNVTFNAIEFISQEEFSTIGEEANERILKEETFSLYLHLEEKSVIATFIPKYNSLHKGHIAYFVMYDSDEYLDYMHHGYYITLFAASIMFLLSLYILYVQLRQKDVLKDNVAEQTERIEQLYTHEHYLKTLLHTITHINKSLITTYSAGSIITNALERLHEHKSYKLVAYSYLANGNLHIDDKIGDVYELLNEKEISIETSDTNHILHTAVECIKTNDTVSSAYLESEMEKSLTHRKEDYDLKSSISILLKQGNSDSLGVVTIFSVNNSFDREEIVLLENVIQDVAHAIWESEQRSLIENLQEEQISNYEETILAFVDMIEKRDSYTAGHTVRVAQYSRLIAQAYKIDEKEIIMLERAAILHDIGKIATPDAILLKPGRLTQLEYSLIKEHAFAGYQMLNKVKTYQDLAQLILYHHEHFDGSGYPSQAKGDEIPFLAHILIIADAFDAMTSNRIYKSRLQPEEACAEILKCAGSQFHPEMAKVAANVLATVTIADTSQLPTTSLEKERFAYFFNDALTGLYNEDYLLLILNMSSHKQQIYKIELSKMNQFNSQYSWDKGSALIKSIAVYLKKTYPSLSIFRYQGDDFIILSNEEIEIDVHKIREIINNDVVIANVFNVKNKNELKRS